MKISTLCYSVIFMLLCCSSWAQTDCALGQRYAGLAEKAQAEYRITDAYDFWSRAAESCPNYDYYQSLGESAVALGEPAQLETAAQAFIRARELGNTNTQRARSAAHYAQMVFYSGDPQRAEQPALYARQLDPESEWISGLVAAIAERKSNPQPGDVRRSLGVAVFAPMKITMGEVGPEPRQDPIRPNEPVPEPVRNPSGTERVFDLPISFKVNSSELEDGSMASLRTVIGDLAKPEFSSNRFVFVGHADVRGDADYNMWLSQRRAVAIVELVGTVAPELRARILPQWKGESEPLYSGDTEDIHRRNRRLEIRILE